MFDFDLSIRVVELSLFLLSEILHKLFFPLVRTGVLFKHLYEFILLMLINEFLNFMESFLDHGNTIDEVVGYFGDSLLSFACPTFSTPYFIVNLIQHQLVSFKAINICVAEVLSKVLTVISIFSFCMILINRNHYFLF